MATPEVQIDGEDYPLRSPLLVLVLTVVTVFIYWLVWYFDVNDQTRRLLRDERIKPWLSLLAIVPGGLLIVPAFVSIYRTGARIRRAELQLGVEKPVHPALGVVCAFLTTVTLIFAGGTGYYYQSHLTAAYRAQDAPEQLAEAAKS
ncbi:DUF4234 domain-containing protein [Curtobacterium sp. USHLN213]|uniref:DUF4234 domain-containing protein n=1 Tax=Curtobacterium sp. USHLN213 TaxID=3081255 RepID=UPI003016EF54